MEKLKANAAEAIIAAYENRKDGKLFYAVAERWIVGFFKNHYCFCVGIALLDKKSALIFFTYIPYEL